MQYSLDLIRTTLRGLYPPGEIASFTRMILEELCGFTTVDIILHKDTILRDEIHKKIASIVERLSHYEPIQYVLGATMFCGRRFAVGKGVLIPRPETEELIDCIIRQNQHKKPEYIADYCTGSGCIAITLAKAWEHVRVEGWDISDEALAYARRNACDNEADVEWGIRDVLAYEPQDKECYDVVVSNPPYVLESEKVTMEHNVLDYEPHNALFVPDENPLLFYEAIARIAQSELRPGGKLYFEINSRMGDACRSLLQNKGWKEIVIYKDFSGFDRIIKAEKQNC